MSALSQKKVPIANHKLTGLIGGSIIYNPEPLERPASGNVLVC